MFGKFLYLLKTQEAAYPRAFQHYKYISFVYKTLIEKTNDTALDFTVEY